MSDARVFLWGRNIGAVSWLPERGRAVFQYTPDFARSNIQLAPLMMPLSPYPYEFPSLSDETFRGLPGLLADSLPDKFGNAVIDAWLATQGRSPESFNPVERLCTIGSRGMGALEYQPALLEKSTKQKEIEIAQLLAISNDILNQRSGLKGVLTGEDDRAALEDILRVGTSAGGARAKAILAWNPTTNQFRSGQVPVADGFQHWILKFDGISNNRDKEIADPQGFGKIEFAYSIMAKEAGIEMTECRLHHEGGRSHFMTRRFDRTLDEGKIHMQSLGAIAHLDYNQPDRYSYEQALQIMKQLGLPQADLEQQVLRAMFNVVGRNQDDHVKNISFLMNRAGEWRLAPAFDVTYAYDPRGRWTGRHQMSINGQREQFSRGDLIGLSGLAGIKAQRADEMLAKVCATLRRWPEFAAQAGVAEKFIHKVQAGLRLSLLD